MEVSFRNNSFYRQKNNLKTTSQPISLKGNDSFIKSISLPSLDEAKEIFSSDLKGKVALLKDQSKDKYKYSQINALYHIKKTHPNTWDKIVNLYNEIADTMHSALINDEAGVELSANEEFVDQIRRIMRQISKNGIIEHYNGFSFITENQKLGEDVIDFFEYYGKLRYLTNLDSEKNVTKDMIAWLPLQKDYVSLRMQGKIDPTNPKNNIDIINNTQEAFYNMLEKAEKNYKQTGRTTTIKFYDMQDLICPDINTNDNIAGMKELMQCSAEEYHTNFLFVLSPSKTHNRESLSSNRVSRRMDISDEPAARSALEYFSKSREEIEPVLDEGMEICKKERIESFKLAKEAKTLEDKLASGLLELDTLYQDPEANQKQILEILYSKEEIDEAVKNIKLNKKHKLIAFASAAAIVGLITGLILLIKKIKAKKALNVVETITKPVLQVASFNDFKNNVK